MTSRHSENARQKPESTVDEPQYSPMAVNGHQAEAEYSDEELWGEPPATSSE